MTETARRDGETERDGKTRDPETESTRDRRRNQDHRKTSERAEHRERPARTIGRRDETIERDGRLGDETIDRRDETERRIRFLGFFRGNALGISCFARGGGVGCGKEKTPPDRKKYKSRGMMNGHKK
ncbi:hypothetical protein Syun_000804 [Stephania yunnanensis]|uniref:Uncharacterized protein n=1 Tax=Stephania yunnanensis TaxID=152371 RepID=A0AAP0LI69_9MAGN